MLVRGAPLGILTDADLRNRVLAVGRGPDTTVGDVATRPVRSLPETATLIDALAFMLEHRVHHAPVEASGRVVGVLTDTDLLRLQVRSPLYLLRNIDRMSVPATSLATRAIWSAWSRACAGAASTPCGSARWCRG